MPDGLDRGLSSWSNKVPSNYYPIETLEFWLCALYHDMMI